MILAPNATFVWPPRTASRIYLTVLGSAVTQLLVDGTQIEALPGKRAEVTVAGNGDTVLANLGPDPVDLAWTAGTVDPLTDPAQARARKHARLADPLRDLITQAWAKAFDTTSGNPFYLPDELRRYDPSTLPDVLNIELGRGFTTMCPGWDNGSAWGDGNGDADLTALTLHRLSTAQYTVPPTFSDLDRTVLFQFGLPTFDLAGKCTLHQRCCHGAFGWCWYTTDHSGWNDFTLSMQDTVLSFNAATVEEPDGRIRVSVTDTQVTIRGARTLRFPGPDWLPDWMRYLTDSWPQIQQFRVATELAAVQSLTQPGVRQLLQTVVNEWIRALEGGVEGGGPEPAHTRGRWPRV